MRSKAGRLALQRSTVTGGVWKRVPDVVSEPICRRSLDDDSADVLLSVQLAITWAHHVVSASPRAGHDADADGDGAADGGGC